MIKCITCQAELIKRDQKKFCSKSCAAKHNNKIPNRKVKERTSLRKCKTEECDEMLYANKDGNRVFCSVCIQQKKHYHGYELNESSIEEVVARRGSNNYDTIRAHCHTLYKAEKKNPICQHCGYNKHIELCHIQSIASFPKETKLKVVNARENILFLCPNCHWEFDHNLLTFEIIKSGPGGIRTPNQAI